MLASIIVDIISKQINKSFDYIVPAHLEKVIQIGHRVRVIFGKRTVSGFVIELKENTSTKHKLKEISDLIDVYPVLNEEFVSLAKYIAENNFSYYALALQTMIPSALKIKYQKIARIINGNEELKVIFKGRKELILDYLPYESQKLIYAAVSKGEVLLDTRFKKQRNEKVITFVYLKDETKEASSLKGKKVVQYLSEIKEEVALPLLLEATAVTKSVIDTLLVHQIIGTYEKEILKPCELQSEIKEEHCLNLEQQKCYESLKYAKAKTYLLHGVTGSGKTLVYMHWIDDVIDVNKQALLLVPEISLTPQMMALFKNRYGDKVAILHSRLSIYDKYSEWKRVLAHEASIVIGARSAIFAPLDKLGIIIIDEEHEKTYIQESNPHYNALEIAQIRSKTHNCPLVLGSATPNVTDYYKAINGEYTLLTLNHRANDKALPNKVVVDMRDELKQGNKSVFSKVLKTKILKTFANKEQTILFLNRRGHSSFVMCRNCGEVIKCPHCDVSLTYHAKANLLKCHHCGYSVPNVSSCPSCGSGRIRFVGSGTEKVMEEINNLLPEAKVLRADLDTTNNLQDYENIFSTFKKHEADVLVGTQMIAKGLDFADVTLVGIINADLALHYPNYDANMTAYNLIEQVSGRAGRGQKKGEVIIQTYNPEHFVIKASIDDNYEEFYQKEIAYRNLTNMPPFSYALSMRVEALDASLAYEEAKKIIYALKQVAKKSEILGPAEAFPFKVNDVFRFIVQVKIVEDEVIDKIKEIYPLYQNDKKVNLKIERM